MTKNETEREIVTYKVTCTIPISVYAEEQFTDIKRVMYDQFRLQPASDVIQYLHVESVTEEFRELVLE